MKLKIDENGHVVVQNGCPVYVYDDGKEVAYDVPQAMAKITELNNEAKNHRLAKEKAEADLKKFDGIDDPVAAKKALETVANLDAKKLIDAGEAESVKKAAIEVYEGKLAEADAKNEKLKGQLHAELIGGAFARSKFVADKMAMPVDMVQAYFGKHFNIDENGAVIAKDRNGNDIFSRIEPGQKAGFEEALEYLVNCYPNKEAILKGSGSSGSGSSPHSSGGKTFKRSQMTAEEVGQFIQEHGREAYLSLPKE